MNSNDCSEVVKIAKDYYDSTDADEFYHSIWGGEDIHIGLYNSDDEPISDASRRTVEKMCSLLTKLNKDSVILDVGAGYGGAARFIAEKYSAQVTCLNLSEKENERNREKNRDKGLDHLIKVVDGNFESLPFDDASFDIVWSEDAILHSGNKEGVFNEIYRVMKKGGEFIFTDPMQADNCPAGVLKPVLERIHLDAFGSFCFYRDYASKIGLEEVNIIDLSEMLIRHYSRVKVELENKCNEIVCSIEYMDRMVKGLNHWVEAGKNEFLKWGILHFRKV